MLKAVKKTLSWFGSSKKFFEAFAKLENYKLLWIKLFFLLFFVIIGSHSYNAYQAHSALNNTPNTESPSFIPIICKGVGSGFTLLAFLISILILKRQRPTTQQKLLVCCLWCGAIGCVLTVLPSDYIATQAAIDGRALAGETHSIPAHITKLLLLGFFILSIPLMTQLYFRLGLMDQYLVKSFLGPFFFNLLAVLSMLMIMDFQDNGGDFGSLYDRMLQFYIVKIPALILMVLPICILLSLLFSLSKLSKSNEFISMIGAGRSVLRILSPLLILGLYFSIVALTLKFEWAPSSDATSESILEEAKAERNRLRQLAKAGKPAGRKKPKRAQLWSQTGWMHVNEFAKRTWFVGYVPLKLKDPMRNVIIFSTDKKGQLETVWQANAAKWDWREDKKTWTLTNGKTYQYNQDGVPNKIPIIKRFNKITLEGWNETPWKVLSSAQKPQHLGAQGLTSFLQANKEMSAQDLAKFRTHRWNIFAEPFTCLVMALMAAPLGIVYGRKGALGGFVAAIAIFALMFIINGTTMALGQRNDIPPFWGAWTCNIVVATLGVFLIWLRTRNRQLPKLKSIISFGLLK